jgi:hypothetical protein
MIRTAGVRSIVRDVMTRDEMFDLDPLDTEFEFCVKMSAFFHPPPDDITGGRISGLYIMDRDIIELRLRLLQHLAATLGFWVQETIQQATAMVLYRIAGDLSVLRFLLSAVEFRRMEEIIFLTVVFWMG